MKLVITTQAVRLGDYRASHADFLSDYGSAPSAPARPNYTCAYERNVCHASQTPGAQRAGGPRIWPEGDAIITALPTLLTKQAAREKAAQQAAQQAAEAARQAAAEVTRKHHTSGKVVATSSPNFRVWIGGNMLGVLQFGPLGNPRCHAHIVADSLFEECRELNRMWLSDKAQRNSESRAISPPFFEMNRYSELEGDLSTMAPEGFQQAYAATLAAPLRA